MISPLKPTHHLLALCDEMFDRYAKHKQYYPEAWRTKSREKLANAGLVDRQKKYLEGHYYFTQTGLDWYLSHRPERRK